MYCKHCGKLINDHSKSCIYCGRNVQDNQSEEELTKTSSVVAQQQPVIIHTGSTQHLLENEGEDEERGSNSGKLTIIIFMAGIIMALILAIVVIILMSGSTPEANTGSPSVTQPVITDEETTPEVGLHPDNIYYDVFTQYSAYVLEGSNNSFKCYTDIVNMTDEELTIAEEEIHARHGKKFTDPDLQEYFEARTWYTPGSGSYTPNYHEQANLDLIRVYREVQDGSLYRSGNVYINAFSKNVDYALPNSSNHTLSGYDLDHLTENQLCVARNEILARHGWVFDDVQLREYFYSKSWYRPAIPGKQFNYAVLSSAEQSNISLIQVYEKRAEGVSWSYDNPYKAVFYNYGYQDYIFYNSSSRYLTEYDLAGMTEDELCIARNEIFARNGYTFKSNNLSEYFLHHEWYYPRTAPGENPYFTAVEEANIDLIAAAEDIASQRSDKTYYPDYISDPYW